VPVLIQIDQQDHHLLSRAREVSAAAPCCPGNQVECLDIGLINNMPDSALIPTERQLFDLLMAASGRLVVRLHFYNLRPTPRSDWARDYVRRYYRETDDLLNRSLDGIIVTGAEPKADRLSQEPYWNSFTQIVDWAKENTTSSVFSCLAVHGTVLHIDGLERHALPEKCIGVFSQARVEDHVLTKGLPQIFKTPHARWNAVQGKALGDCGYSVLSRSVEAGVDCFVKQHGKSLFVNFQGHPEYETLSLLGEYRRDMGRFLRGESEVCPTIPKNYFNAEARKILIQFETEAKVNRCAEFFAGFPTDRLARTVRNVWQSPAKRIYRNWLLYLKTHRSENPRGLNQFAVGT
jgi:homoserine O-succinyltransferase/O-acetyltransferase